MLGSKVQGFGFGKQTFQLMSLLTQYFYDFDFLKI
jgi:hypothetical protein